LMCASAGLDGLPYALAPGPGCAGLGETLEGAFAAGHVLAADPRLPPGPPLPRPRTRDDPDTWAPAWPFDASSRLVAVLARSPARELPGIRFVLRPEFDVTPEPAVISGNGRREGAAGSDPAVPLGIVLDWNRIPAGVLAVPWLVVEPAKAEYRLMAARLPGTEVIRVRPGELGDPPAGINPLEPAADPDGAWSRCRPTPTTTTTPMPRSAVVLGELISEERLDDAGLDAFLAEARALADARLAAQSGDSP
jgi:uncharacterized protein